MIKFSDIKMRPKLISLLVIFGVLPMLAAAIFASQLASKSLVENSFDKLHAIQSLRRASIEDFFHEKLIDIRTIASGERAERLTKMLLSKDKTGLELEKGHFRNAIKGFIGDYEFSDLLILDSGDGEILYSLNEREREGEKMRSGQSNDEALVKAWQAAVRSEMPSFTDFAEQNDGQEGYIAYLSSPVRDSQGNLNGVLVLKVTPKLISKIVGSRVGMGETGESYLIGVNEQKQFEFRSDLVTMGSGRYVVGYQLDRTLDYWVDAQTAGLEGGQSVYTDSAGNQVLVTFDKVNIPGYDWYLISKINQDEVTAPIRTIYETVLGASLIMILFVAFVARGLARSIVDPLVQGMSFAKDISQGKLDASLELDRKDEVGSLGSALNDMAGQLRDMDWIQSGKENLDDQLRGDLEVDEISRRFITFFTKHMGVQLGVLYLFDEEEKLLNLQSSYAFVDREGNFNRIKLGEGIVGQSALEQEVIVFNNVTRDAPALNYGSGEVIPSHFMSIPLMVDGHLLGAILLGSQQHFTPLQRKFVEEVVANAAVLFNAANARQIIEKLLQQAQQQQESLLDANKELEAQTDALKKSEQALQTQQEELRVTNEELEEQTKVLKESEAELQAQQEELRVTNEELEERTKALEDQKIGMQEKNDELHLARQVVEDKAKELEIASKYKSEFLANMSHELRTPLNSILILSQLLSGNKDGNLSDKQIESAKAINSSGSDLLSLINEILDLSKVEAGKIELHIEDVGLDSIDADITRLYKDIAEEKGLDFQIIRAGNVPKSIQTDSQRLQQVLRNLLTNAFKFTHEGSVTLNMSMPTPEMAMRLNKPREELLAFHVKDDGIGIKEEQQAAIFQAFQQADGSTSRKYGGTGLGLSISKELTHLLGGEILLKSKEGEGSTFTVVLPVSYEAKQDAEEAPIKPSVMAEKPQEVKVETPPVETVKDPEPKPEPQIARPTAVVKPKEDSYVEDDRQSIVPEDRTLLIIEDDRAFAGVMRDFGRERGFKCIVAETGETGLHFADYYKPSAIILDIGLPGIDGWTVMERLKENPDLRHIPVHFMSASDENLDAMRMGAIGYLTKPVDVKKMEKAFGNIEDIISKPVKRLLVVEDDEIQRDSICELVGDGDIVISAVSTGRAALKELESKPYDCMILDLGLEDMTGFDLLEKIRRSEKAARVPIIVYTGRELTQDEEKDLNQYAESIIIKGVKSPERLLDESALFLHRVEANLPVEQQAMLQAVHDKESVLQGKKVLLVDDDMRNVFALSSILDDKGMEIVIARDGAESLEKLKENLDIDLVLMDIMMPKMDGYEAMREIRKQRVHDKLPIIALTAKAMKGDRSKCIEAGASDYLAKPIDTGKLLSMLRVWLY
ncbi:response regulator [Vibrio sp. JC009]|uniref:response regulator n=1 Tax=Vibrio sp. JC009 TaxID=2912314 RepID=UPI0023B07356|nr:response regulator [Vibrio sp. JC009]WED21443.1 response regulator [Vibrio sp. JC009]